MQFSAIDAPLLDDTRYEPVRSLYDGCNSSFKFGPDPLRIGLHCCAINTAAVQVMDDGHEENNELKAALTTKLSSISLYEPWWTKVNTS